MIITNNLLKLILLIGVIGLMIFIVVRPGTESAQDAITHMFALVVGVILHQVAEGKANGSDTKAN